jgi:formate hydrogenlyase subunit 6/NADH:ubiquinone oxidoreductase subunit I
MGNAFVISKQDLLKWLKKLQNDTDIIAPVLKKKGEFIFESIKDVKDITFDYPTSMTSPRKFVYPPRQDLFKIDRNNNKVQLPATDKNKTIVFGIHPCDMQAVSILDRTFLGDFNDCYYKNLRENTITVVVNCNKACTKKYPNYTLKGFCSSMGSGPFLKLKSGYDIELTVLDKKDYLIEAGSPKGLKLIGKGFKPASKKELIQKTKLAKKASSTFTKKLDTKGLPELLAKNLDHSIYKETADSKCLGCTNCTMVCPTCFCYNIQESTPYDLKTSSRERHWDSCQEVNFAKVHDGNFRSSRASRLRQFVTHKLSTWLEQYDCFGCVGCGRCMTWCPTNIDLTDIAKEIQKGAKSKVKRGAKA